MRHKIVDFRKILEGYEASGSKSIDFNIEVQCNAGKVYYTAIKNLYREYIQYHRLTKSTIIIVFNKLEELLGFSSESITIS